MAGQQLTHLLQREGPRLDQVRQQHEDARRFLHRAARRYRWDDDGQWQQWLAQSDKPFDWMLHRLDGDDLSRGLHWNPEFESLIRAKPLRGFRKPLALKDGALIVQPLMKNKRLEGFLLAKVKHPHPLVVEWLYEHL